MIKKQNKQRKETNKHEEPEILELKVSEEKTTAEAVEKEDLIVIYHR